MVQVAEMVVMMMVRSVGKCMVSISWLISFYCRWDGLKEVVMYVGERKGFGCEKERNLGELC
jgi:hypothetical protein